jgi:hypothetical protein
MGRRDMTIMDRIDRSDLIIELIAQIITAVIVFGLLIFGRSHVWPFVKQLICSVCQGAM